jgi:uncharacterized phosphosugar-binding protein
VNSNDTSPNLENAKLALEYLDGCEAILRRVRETQMDKIVTASQWCAQAIASRHLVHLFGNGHSRMAVEEFWPRYGSYPGYHPIVELSMTNHHQVTGANGQRQAMWIERQEGLGQIIMRNFIFHPEDVMICFSTSGNNGVVVDVALEAKRLGMKLIVVIAEEYARMLPAGHSSGQRLHDLADLVLDNCAVPGDAMVDVPGVDVPVGPGSTIGNTAIVNSIKVLVAQELAARGQPPLVLAGAWKMGKEASARRFDDAYDDHRDRVKVVYGG